MPGWVALPSGVAAVSLIGAVFGYYWDVSLHIDNGRDAGPLANPAHYFILAGLFGIFAAGWLAIVLPEGKPSPHAVKITRDWYAPVSGVLMMGRASFALLGFPLDDVWHRLFGQDVTLWGPTHLMMLSGAALTLIGILGLMSEGRSAEKTPAPPGGVKVSPTLVTRLRTARVIAATGGLLIGLSIYQGEFDFGVPQFRLLFHPVLIAIAASCALTAARVLGGRGAALGAVGFYLVVRGLLTVIVADVFGEAVAHFPLFIAEGLIVEAVAWRATKNTPSWKIALPSSVLIGTVGVAARCGGRTCGCRSSGRRTVCSR